MDSPDRVAAHLARNLASLRHARGLTQEALAKAAAVPRSTIANLESSVGNPSLTVLVKVANALAVPIDELTAAPRAKVRQWAATDVATQSRGRGVTMLVTSMPWSPRSLLSRCLARSSAWAKLVGLDTLIVDSRPNSSRRIERAYGSIHS